MTQRRPWGPCAVADWAQMVNERQKDIRKRNIVKKTQRQRSRHKIFATTMSRERPFVDPSSSSTIFGLSSTVQHLKIIFVCARATADFLASTAYNVYQAINNRVFYIIYIFFHHHMCAFCILFDDVAQCE